jgi:hypothetical protein
MGIAVDLVIKLLSASGVLIDKQIRGQGKAGLQLE